MVNIPRITRLGAVLLLCVPLAAPCASMARRRAGRRAAPDAAQAGFTIAPTSGGLVVGQTLQFIAAHNATIGPPVAWEVNGVAGGNASVGTISSSGLYTAPAEVPKPATVTIKVLLQADTAKTASAVITIKPPQASLSIAPGSVLVALGGTRQFSAKLSNTSSNAVTWEVNGAIGGSAAAGTISSAGLYAAPAQAPSPALVVVTAVSQANPAAAANVLVSVGSGATYYVSTPANGGNDGNAGSQAAPWATIQHAASKAVAGDTVFVNGGVYNEVVTLPHSGSAAAGYITFESTPGQTAVIDGTGLDVPGGQYGLITLQDQSYVAVGGFELRNYFSASGANVPIGLYILGSGSKVQVLGNHIHNIATLASAGANDCDTANALGMAISGTEAPAAISSLTVLGNELDQLTTGCSESMSFDGNVDGWTAANNIVHDNNNIGILGSGFYGTSPEPAYDQARNGEVSGNIVYDITSYDNPSYGKQYAADGVYVDGGTLITIERNLIHATDLGIELASETPGKVTSSVIARNNLIYASNSAGISIGGYDGSVGGSKDCTVVNNSLLGNDTQNTGSGEFQIQYHASGNVFKNNILSSTAEAQLVYAYVPTTPASATLDYNLYYSPVDDDNSSWTWQNVTYGSLSAYQAASAQDRHSQFANPLYLSSLIPNLRLGAGSPALNAGDDLGAATAGTRDFAGNARTQGATIDMGAYEMPAAQVKDPKD